MCTSFVYNGNKILVGWNLDILDLKHRITAYDKAVFIEINDKNEGWMPLFGVNAEGCFVAMPTCHPYDKRSDPESIQKEIAVTEPEITEKENDKSENFNIQNIINLDIDLLLSKKSFEETRKIAKDTLVSSVQGVTFMAQLSDRDGNVLQIVPGQGTRYLEKPRFSVLTNFSPFKGDSELHPWMGLDRFNIATQMLHEAGESLDVDGCFKILEATAQTICPTVASMVYDASENRVYWCEQQNWTDRNEKQLIDKRNRRF